MAVFTDPFSEIAAVLAVAAGVGALALWLRQPLIIAFIFVGILLGPAGLNWVHALDQVDLFAKLGIGLLPFVVGLKLDLHLIRSVGRVVLADRQHGDLDRCAAERLRVDLLHLNSMNAQWPREPQCPTHAHFKAKAGDKHRRTVWSSFSSATASASFRIDASRDSITQPGRIALPLHRHPARKLRPSSA